LKHYNRRPVIGRPRGGPAAHARFSIDRDGVDVTLEASFAMAGLGMDPVRLEHDIGAWRLGGHRQGCGNDWRRDVGRSARPAAMGLALGLGGCRQSAASPRVARRLM